MSQLPQMQLRGRRALFRALLSAGDEAADPIAQEPDYEAEGPPSCSPASVRGGAAAPAARRNMRPAAIPLVRS